MLMWFHTLLAVHFPTSVKSRKGTFASQIHVKCPLSILHSINERFSRNGAKNRKSGRAMFLALLSPNFMPSFGKIVGADLEIARSERTYVRTYVRTHGGYFTAPFGFQPGTKYRYK